MHVVHLNLQRGWRGGERQVFWLLRELQREGVPQTLVCRRGSPLEERIEVLNADARPDQPAVLVVPAGNRLAALLRMPRRRAGHVYHAHTGNTAPLALLGAGGRGRSVITRRLVLPVTGLLFSRADRVVAISQRVYDVLLDAGLPEERLALIPSAIDRDRSIDAAETARLREGLGLAERCFVGLTVAALVEEKDPMALVRALVELPEDHVHVWVGSGELAARVETLAAELGVSQRLYLPGFDPEPDRWFGLADLFVLPSRHEGLGSVLLDAFHFGVPVVGSEIPATSDLLRHEASALLFAPGDTHGLAAAILRLRDDRDLAAALVAEGERLVSGYDVRGMARSYLELYEELLATG